MTCTVYITGVILLIRNDSRIKDLNVRLETIKILEENISRTLFDINRHNLFLDLSLKAN